MPPHGLPDSKEGIETVSPAERGVRPHPRGCWGSIQAMAPPAARKERHTRPWETRTVISLEALMMRRSFHMHTYRSAMLKGKRIPRPGAVAGHAQREEGRNSWVWRNTPRPAWGTNRRHLPTDGLLHVYFDNAGGVGFSVTALTHRAKENRRPDAAGLPSRHSAMAEGSVIRPADDLLRGFVVPFPRFPC